MSKKMRRSVRFGTTVVKYTNKEHEYMQFDISLSDFEKQRYLKKMMNNPKEVTKHRFLPFVLRTKSIRKIREVKKNNVKQLEFYTKDRPLVETAHKDALIYQLYGSLLSDKYETFLQDSNLDDVVTAYRSGHGSTIEFAREAVDYATLNGDSWIIKCDFSHFFDNIKPFILKRKLCEVLNVDKLSGDWYAVFKSLTSYHDVRVQDIPISMKMRAKKIGKYVNDLMQLELSIKSGSLKISREHDLGIPQGTAISAILANVYMKGFDVKVNRLVNKFEGIYRRYCDDFIIVIPGVVNANQIRQFMADVKNLVKLEVNLTLKDKKTKIAWYNQSEHQIYKLEKNVLKKSSIDYLGISFDGKSVSLRGKGLLKNAYKGKRLVREVTYNERKVIENKKKHVFNHGKVAHYYLKNDVDRLTYQGYAMSANKVFSGEGNYDMVISRQLKNRTQSQQYYLNHRRKGK